MGEKITEETIEQRIRNLGLSERFLINRSPINEEERIKVSNSLNDLIKEKNNKIT